MHGVIDLPGNKIVDTALSFARAGSLPEEQLEFIPEIDVRPSELVVQKEASNAFWETNLVEILNGPVRGRSTRRSDEVRSGARITPPRSHLPIWWLYRIAPGAVPWAGRSVSISPELRAA